MRPGFLLFPFAAGDQARINAATLVAVDIPYAAAPAAGQPYPQALRLRFGLHAATPVVRVRPLFPGLMRFIADPAASGVTPTPDTVVFDSANYATWRTVGTLRVKVDVAAAKEMRGLFSDFPVLPNVVWYGPVRVTEDFLFTTLRQRLRKTRIGGTPSIAPNSPEWERHAVARFLEGRYEPVLRAGDTAAQDDRIAHPMPAVHPASDGSVTLVLTAANRKAP